MASLTGLDRALAFTAKMEGGYSDHASDRGGATNLGITQKTYSAFLERHSMTANKVEDITSEEVHEIAREMYWLPARCYKLPAGLAVVQFDSAFNHGPARAIHFLQTVLCIVSDGLWGNQTELAVSEGAGKAGVVDRYLHVRKEFYAQIIRNDPTQAVFRNGWNNRVELLRAEVLG